MAGIQEEEFERVFTYDSLGRVTAETVTKSGASVSIGYTYSSTTGDLVAMTYPSGNVIQFTRDANGQISAIQAGNISLATEITRLPFGPIKSEKLRGVLPLTRTFDQRYQMSRIQAGNVDVQYTRDAAGRVTNVTGIAEPTLTVGTEAYSVNSSNNQMTARGTVNYTYDAAGNLASDGTRTFTWDALGRLKQVQQGNQTVATYGYDIQNRRFRKTVGSTTTYYLYNLDDQLIAEISGTGTVLREYVWLDGEPFLLAEYTGTSAGMYFYVNDHLGTPQQLLNGETGAVAWQAAYLPFGEAQVQVNTVTNNLRFPGQYYDAETGLHYNWNRYYDPNSGRYISTDPIGIDGELNLYTYTDNDSINIVDPYGEFGLIGALIGGGIDIITQLAINGGRFQCIKWGQVVVNTGLGAIGGGLVNGLWKGAFKIKKIGSHTWGATKKWGNSKNIRALMTNNTRDNITQHRHHWLFQQNQGWGKNISDSIKNQPWNINVVSKEFNSWMNQGNTNLRSLLGAPAWIRGISGGVAVASIGTVMNIFGDDIENCECQ